MHININAEKLALHMLDRWKELGIAFLGLQHKTYRRFIEPTIGDYDWPPDRLIKHWKKLEIRERPKGHQLNICAVPYSADESRLLNAHVLSCERHDDEIVVQTDQGELRTFSYIKSREMLKYDNPTV